MRFAYSTINWGPEADLPAAFAEIRQAGWQAVELFGHSLDWLGPPSRVAAMLDGMAVATLFASVELPGSERQITIHQRRIDWAAEIGAEDYGLVGGTRLRWRPPSAEEYQDLSTLCEQLAEYGASRGVRVSYHPHTACTIETSEEIERLLTGTRHLQLCLDASHIALVGEDPLDVLERYWERTGYVHLKDWTHGKFVELGRGSLGIDFPAILRRLNERNFNGWIVVEQSRSDVSPVESAHINARYLHDLGYTIT